MTQYAKLPRLIRRLMSTACVLVLLALAAGYLGDFWWGFDLFSHFRLQYSVALALLLFGLILLRAWMASIACGFGLLLALGGIVGYYLPRVDSCAGESIRVLSFNVHTANPAKQRVIDLIRESDADIVALYEVDRAWVSALGALNHLYPHSKFFPRQDNFGIALLSRVPLRRLDVAFFGSASVPSIVANLPLGQEHAWLVATHPVPPMGAIGTRWRDEQLAQVTEKIQTLGASRVVLVGDLNATPWSQPMRLLRAAGLTDARRGFGVAPTWMRRRPWISIPIDHVLVGSDFCVMDVRVLDATGSDHNPILARIAKKS